MRSRIDEATSTLPPAESRRVIESLRTTVGEGAAVVMVTHKLSEILDACERVVVLLDGRLAADEPIAGLDRAALVRMLLQHETARAEREGGHGALRPHGEVLLELQQACAGRAGPVDLELRAGEVVGLTGLPGSGLHDVGFLAHGALRPTRGRVVVKDNVRRALVPPHRETQGGFPGLTVRQKLLAQIVIAFVTAVGLNQLRSPVLLSTTLLSWLPASTGWLFVPWAMFVMVATSNAVNLTDGLDGLASGCTVISALTMTVLVILISGSQPGNAPSREAMAGFAALCGAVLGFLWFNRHPAKVFMGDAGSLPIGGMLAVLSLVCQMELLLLLTAFVFVVETLSVILQVGWYRRTGRRILLCSPLHNHFVFKGIPEPRIVRGFWAATGFFCMTAVFLVWVL